MQSPFVVPFLYRINDQSHDLGEIGNCLSSPTRKKPAYLSGSTYSGSYDNAMEMVHGQVRQMRYCCRALLLERLHGREMDRHGWKTRSRNSCSQYTGHCSRKSLCNPLICRQAMNKTMGLSVVVFQASRYTFCLSLPTCVHSTLVFSM